MKPDAFLINTARGPVIRHRALEQGWIAGDAPLDVLEEEPLGLDMFAHFPTCILTPHSAFYWQESIVEMRRTSALIVKQALLEQKLRKVVNGAGAHATGGWNER